MFLAALVLMGSIALMAILVAIMTHAFEAHLAAPRTRWHIERARIIMQVLFGVLPITRATAFYPSYVLLCSSRAQ